METLVHGTIDQNTERVNILLHGFPGISTNQNRDIAPVLTEKTGDSVDHRILPRPFC